MVTHPAIVICAYNRPASLARLLSSVAGAVYESGGVQLVISIDRSDTDEVKELAEAFEWKHGAKHIISHKQNLGLKAHILSCGALSITYGAVILLEDDIVVSPYFYSYARQALAAYRYDARIAGISLYNYQVSESSFYAFNAIDDGSDVYFMQVASSRGQLWTAEQWQGFEAWHQAHSELPDNPKIPAYLQLWGPKSWKKHFIHYLADTGKYFVFPRLSLTTNFEDYGTHAFDGNLFQVPLQLAKKDYKLGSLDASGARYDAWFELLPGCLGAYNKQLQQYEYEVDIYGTKDISGSGCDYILTSRTGSEPALSFGTNLFPLELNIATGLKGQGIGLYKRMGNDFGPVTLSLRNLMEEQVKEARLGISVIVPVNGQADEQIAATLRSVADQRFGNKECIVVSHLPLSPGIRELISTFGFPVRILRPPAGLSLEGLVAEGFQMANKGIVTWTGPGNVFAEDALQKAHSVFRSNLSISWIRGVDEAKGHDAALNVRRYRLTADEAWRRLNKGSLAFSMEQDFFKKHVVASSANDPSFTHVFLSGIQSYQLFILVSKLGDKPVDYAPFISSAERQQLLAAYSHLKQERSLVLLLIDVMLQAFFASSKPSQWIYPSFQKFPNVLRYDAVHNTFYLARY